MSLRLILTILYINPLCEGDSAIRNRVYFSFCSMKTHVRESARIRRSKTYSEFKFLWETQKRQSVMSTVSTVGDITAYFYLSQTI